MIVIVDYGVGNTGSIRNMLRRLGHPVEVTSAPEVIRSASRLILPGVGSFDTGMTQLRRLGLVDALNDAALVRTVPTLGICLGAQLMTRSSEEGREHGLAWIDAITVRFFSRSSGCGLKVPSMGWNEVYLRRPHALFDGLHAEARFYFVHSYHFYLNVPGDTLTVSHYGYEFASSFARDNVWGVQFHPEKSHKFGMKLLDNFARADWVEANAPQTVASGARV